MSSSRILVIFILIAYALRVQGLDKESLWRDEVDAIYFALRDLPETLSMFVSEAQNGPLYFLSLRPWFQLVGSGEFALRYPSALAGVIALPLLWQVARILLCPTWRAAEEPIERPTEWPFETSIENTSKRNDRVNHFLCVGGPLLSTLFLAINPYQLWYSQEGKMYALIVALFLLASWLWLRGIERNHWGYWLGYLSVTSLSIYSHLLMILVIPLHVVWFFIAWPRSKHAWRGYGSALLGLTLPYLPMVWWQWDMLTASNKRTGYSYTPFAEVLELLLTNHSRSFVPALDLLWLAPLFFVGLAGIILGGLELKLPNYSKDIQHVTLSGWRRYLIIISWLIIPILLIHGLSLRQPIFVDRYIIWIGPAALLLLAIGLAVIWQNALSLSKPLIVLLVIYICGFWLYASWQQQQMTIKYDLRSAVRTVAENRKLDDLLILQIPHTEYSYRYYSSDQGAYPFVGSTERLGNWEGGLWTNNGHPDEQARAEVAESMENITQGMERVWVIRSEVEMWDARHLMDEWLKEHGNLVQEWHYHGSQVHYYEFR